MHPQQEEIKPEFVTLQERKKKKKERNPRVLNNVEEYSIHPSTLKREKYKSSKKEKKRKEK